MKRVFFAIFAAASAAGLAAPAHATVDTVEMDKAYQKGKKGSLVGKQSMYDELKCFLLYNVWAKLTVTYDQNLAKINGELSSGYTQIQFYHYTLAWAGYQQAGGNYKKTYLGIIEEIEKRNFEKDKELRKLATELGQCAVPLNKVRTIAQDQGRADSWMERSFNQPYTEPYPKWVKDKKAWNLYSAAWRAGNPLVASRTVIDNYNKGDKSTFHDNEYLVAVEALVDIGEAAQLSQADYLRAAYLKPDKFAELAGYAAADFKPQIRMIKGRASYLGSGSQSARARTDAENDAKYKCELAKGKVVRVSSVPVESYRATDTTVRSTYEATAQCQFPPKLGG